MKEGPFGRRKDGTLVKRVNGRLVYFGKDFDKAMERWEREGSDLKAGRTPRPDPVATTVRDACNAFLSSKKAKVDRGGLTARRWADLKATCDLIVSTFGRLRLVDDLHPEDFAKLRAKMSARWKGARTKNEITSVRAVFRHAKEARLIEREVSFGPDFAPPSAGELRREKATKGLRLFGRDEVHRLLLAGDTQDVAMILLGINCGYQGSDIGGLRLDHLDLEGGWATFPRGKTGIGRKAKLWPETVEALRRWLAERPTDKDGATIGLVFLTRYATAWTQHDNTCALAIRFEGLARRAGVTLGNGKGFATLRKTFRTEGGDSCDREALGYIMGHNDPTMAGVYVQRISDARLANVAYVVHSWLFGQSAG